MWTTLPMKKKPQYTFACKYHKQANQTKVVTPVTHLLTLLLVVGNKKLQIQLTHIHSQTNERWKKTQNHSESEMFKEVAITATPQPTTRKMKTLQHATNTNVTCNRFWYLLVPLVIQYTMGWSWSKKKINGKLRFWEYFSHILLDFENILK